MMMKYLTILLLVLMSFLTTVGQSTQFNGLINDNWSVAGNWTNGIPSATTNVSLSIGANLNIDGIAACNNLALFLSSLIIQSGQQLTINGLYTATTSAVNKNEGTLILNGGLKPAIGGDTVLTMGNGGGATIECGLEFSNFSIDR